MTIRDKGARVRQVPGNVVQELDALDERNGHVYILAEVGEESAELSTWSTSGTYQAIKRFMLNCATKVEPHDAAAPRRASVHRLRRDHGSH